MGQLQIFDFGDYAVRVVEDGGEVYFVANDVCRALEYVNPRKAIADHIDPEDVTKRDTLSNGGQQEMNCVNESGLYSLIFGSKKAAAKKFKRWVTSEVLPTIRQTGGYGFVENIALEEDSFNKYEELLLQYMRRNSELEYRLDVVSAELEIYKKLERRVQLHDGNLHIVTRDWINKVKH